MINIHTKALLYNTFMNNFIIIILLALIFMYSLFMNFKLIKRYSSNKEYVECYKAMNYKDEGCKERIEKFINETKTDLFKNKARVLLLCCRLDDKQDYGDILNELDLRSVFYVKNKFSAKETDLNSDIFIWVIEAMIKAKKNKDKKLIEGLYAKFNGCDELESYAEFRTVSAVKNALLDKSDIKWFHDLLDGEYTDYKYDKKLIGIYKRISSCMCAYFKESIDEYFVSDLGKFKNTMIGANIMKDLGIYDKYHDEEDKKENPINSEE